MAITDPVLQLDKPSGPVDKFIREGLLELYPPVRECKWGEDVFLNVVSNRVEFIWFAVSWKSRLHSSQKSPYKVQLGCVCLHDQNGSEERKAKGGSDLICRLHQTVRGESIVWKETNIDLSAPDRKISQESDISNVSNSVSLPADSIRPSTAPSILKQRSLKPIGSAWSASAKSRKFTPLDLSRSSITTPTQSCGVARPQSAPPYLSNSVEMPSIEQSLKVRLDVVDDKTEELAIVLLLENAEVNEQSLCDLDITFRIFDKRNMREREFVNVSLQGTRWASSTISIEVGRLVRVVKQWDRGLLAPARQEWAFRFKGTILNAPDFESVLGKFMGEIRIKDYLPRIADLTTSTTSPQNVGVQVRHTKYNPLDRLCVAAIIRSNLYSFPLNPIGAITPLEPQLLAIATNSGGTRVLHEIVSSVSPSGLNSAITYALSQSKDGVSVQQITIDFTKIEKVVTAIYFVLSMEKWELKGWDLESIGEVKLCIFEEATNKMSFSVGFQKGTLLASCCEIGRLQKLESKTSKQDKEPSEVWEWKHERRQFWGSREIPNYYSLDSKSRIDLWEVPSPPIRVIEGANIDLWKEWPFARNIEISIRCPNMHDVAVLGLGFNGRVFQSYVASLHRISCASSLTVKTENGLSSVFIDIPKVHPEVHSFIVLLNTVNIESNLYLSCLEATRRAPLIEWERKWNPKSSLLSKKHKAGRKIRFAIGANSSMPALVASSRHDLVFEIARLARGKERWGLVCGGEVYHESLPSVFSKFESPPVAPLFPARACMLGDTYKLNRQGKVLQVEVLYGLPSVFRPLHIFVNCVHVVRNSLKMFSETDVMGYSGLFPSLEVPYVDLDVSNLSLQRATIDLTAARSDTTFNIGLVERPLINPDINEKAFGVCNIKLDEKLLFIYNFSYSNIFHKQHILEFTQATEWSVTFV